MNVRNRYLRVLRGRDLFLQWFPTTTIGQVRARAFLCTYLRLFIRYEKTLIDIIGQCMLFSDSIDRFWGL